MRRGSWWLVAAAVGVALTLEVGAAALVWQHTRPRLPRLAPAVSTLDQAIAAVITAAGDSAAATVSDLVPSAACQHTLLAKGHYYTRTADLYTNPGTENTLITRIATALPAADHPQRGARTGNAAPLTAQPAPNVQLQVIQIDQGWVAATAKTDCRAAAPPATAAVPPADATTVISALLASLGTAPASWHVDTVACPTGHIITVDALSATTSTDHLRTRLAAAVPAGAQTFASISNRLAWHDKDTSIVVAASDDGTHITAQRTTTC